MHGDFSNDKFGGPTGGGLDYSRVLFQQGRPITDADINELSARLLATNRLLARSLGRCQPIHEGFNFAFDADEQTASFGLGYRFVNGIACVHRKDEIFNKDELIQVAGRDNEEYWVYLEVRENAIPSIVDPIMRETALGNLDVSMRSKTRWAIRLRKKDPDSEWNEVELFKDKFLKHLEGENGSLDVRCLPSPELSAACVANDLQSPDPSLECRLYRIEIHSRRADEPSDLFFKWSRENGAALFAVTPLNGKTSTKGLKLKLEPTPSSTRFQLNKHDWVELLDKHGDPIHPTNSIFQIKYSPGEIIELTSDWQSERAESTITTSEGPVKEAQAPRYLRRWMSPQTQNVTTQGIAVESVDRESWLQIEEGIEIRFRDIDHFQTGEYFLIPVRIDRATRQVFFEPSWDQTIPEAQRDEGQIYTYAVRGSHEFAPLGWLKMENMNWTGESLENEPNEANPGENVRTDDQTPDAENQVSSSPNSDCVENLADSSQAECPALDNESGSEVASDEPLAAAPQPRPESMLSSAGKAVFKHYFTTPRELLRRIPARYLKTAVSYEPLAQYLAPALVSELTNLSLEDFARRFQKTVVVDEKDWPLFVHEASQVLKVANEFDRALASESGMAHLLTPPAQV